LTDDGWPLEMMMRQLSESGFTGFQDLQDFFFFLIIHQIS
jgi:hypothetical protein